MDSISKLEFAFDAAEDMITQSPESEVIESIEEKQFYESEDAEDDGTPLNGKIFITKTDFSLREYQTMNREGELILKPGYQRKFVVDLKFASKLIESIILDVPIPPVFLAEEADGKYSVIDGQQRLTSFISFLDGYFPDKKQTVFKLTGVKDLDPSLKGKTFSQISDITVKNKLKTTSIQAIIIRNQSHPDLKFAIFERLNTGAVKLNEDELRNTIYRGNYIDLLAELEEDTVFHSLVRKDLWRKRMIYRGIILRFLALSDKSYLNYRSSMKQFCNKELRDNRNMVPAKRQEYIEKFKKACDLVKIVFGENAFRRFKAGDDKNPNGKWVAIVNLAVYDIQMCCFLEYSKQQVVSKADLIRERMIALMTTNQEFISAIENKTNDTIVLKKRFEIWREELTKIIGLPANEPRSFKLSDKKKLFAQDPTCAICHQEILSIEDAELDHIEPYNKNGKTVLENAQLTHRYCNRAKGDRA